MKNFLFIMVLATVVGCESGDKIRLSNYPNPVAIALKNKRIGRVVSLDSVFTKYLRYDNEGRLVCDSSILEMNKYEYDTNGYLVRYFYNSDVWSNYLIENHLEGDSLFQKWIPIKEESWLFDSSKLDYSKVEMKAYHIMKNGKPSVFVEESGDYTLFNYDDFGRLISKVTRRPSLKFEGWIQSELYYYSQSLDSIEIKYGDKVLTTKYFSSGVLDSVSDDGLITRYKQFDK